MFRNLIVIAFATCAFAQQPLVYNRMIVNAASYIPQGLPGGGIAQGAIFTIFGSNLGPDKGVIATTYPLGNTLAGTSVTVSQGSTTINAIPIYVSGSQINAIMPSNAPAGLDALRVVVGNVQSNAVRVQVVASALGIFATSSGGFGPGILQNYVSPDNLPVNSPTITAQPGQTIILWATGLGPITGGDNVPPAGGNLSIKTEVFVGGLSAPVAYSGRAPGLAGVDQINFVVPQSAPSGCWVPVYVRTNGTTISNFVTMAIDPDGKPCSDPANPLAATLVSGGKAGGVAVVRASTHEDIGTLAPIDVATDFSVGAFSTIASAPFAFHPMISLPPPGTCTEYTGGADIWNANFAGILPAPAGATLNAGSPPQVRGPAATFNLTSLLPGYLGALIGSSAGATRFSGSLSLTPGNYTVSGGGSSDVGSYTSQLTVPPSISWTNRDQLNQINRSQPLTISWSGGGANDVVGVVGIGADLPSNSAAVFACVAQPGAGSMTIPTDVLANVPPTQQYVLSSTDVIYLVTVPQSAIGKLNATGLDAGIALFTYINGKTVIFQ